MLGNIVCLYSVSKLVRCQHFRFCILGHYTFSRMWLESDYYGQLGNILYCYIRDYDSKIDQ